MTDNKKGRKTTEVEYEQRIVEATEMILYERMNYVQFRVQASKKYGITERQAESIWSDVKNRIKAKFKDEQDTLIEAQVERYFDLLQRCKSTGNRRIEKEVLDSLTKLYGLETKKIDVTSNGEPISININLTD